MAAEDGDFHRRDLWETLDSGKQASWSLEMQIMPVEDAENYRFNPFDLTKVWPHADYPLQPVGRLVLDRNPTDYFAEVEQSAFEPANMVPGIEASPDKMLLGRLFSYPDAHRYRIGTNYLQLPINRPRNEVHSYNKDGAMRISNPGDPVYAPNSRGGPAADPEAAGEKHVDWSMGQLMRAPYKAHRDDDDFVQPRALIDDVLESEEIDHLVENVAGHASAGVTPEIRKRVAEYWRKIHPEVGERIGKKILP
jgi:catalase